MPRKVRFNVPAKRSHCSGKTISIIRKNDLNSPGISSRPSGETISRLRHGDPAFPKAIFPTDCGSNHTRIQRAWSSTHMPPDGNTQDMGTPGGRWKASPAKASTAAQPRVYNARNTVHCIQTRRPEGRSAAGAICQQRTVAWASHAASGCARDSSANINVPATV